MTECNSCGSCCDPVILPYTQEQAREFNMHPDDKRWTLEDLTPMSRHQAKAKEPEYVRRLLKIIKRAGAELPHFYSCRHFDPSTRTCTNYDNRPPVCRKYPWLTGKPVVGTPLPQTCSFRADIGEPVAP